MHLVFIRHVLLFFASVWSMMVMAQNVNLLQNPDFIPDRANSRVIPGWEIKPDNTWERKEILAFQGAPISLYYLEGKVGLLFQSPVPLCSNTWYVLSALCRAELQPAPNSHNVWLNLSEPCGSYVNRIGGTSMGACRRLLPMRAYVNSGAWTNARFQVVFFGSGSNAVGQCSLRLMNEADFRGPFLSDGDFELGVTNACPFDWTAGTNYPQPVVAVDGGRPGGGQSMKLEIPAGQSLRLSGPAIPVQPGMRVRLRFLARADRDGIILMSSINCSMPYYAGQQGNQLTGAWQEFVMDKTLPVRGERRYAEGTNLARLVFGTIKMSAAATIWIDDVSLAGVLPEADSADQDLRFGNLIRNGSFESGAGGWLWFFVNNVFNIKTNFQSGQAVLDCATAAEGVNSLRLRIPETIDKGAPCSCLAGTTWRAAAGESYGISFWARAETPATVRLEIGPYCQATDVLLTNEWRRYEANLKSLKQYRDYHQLMFKFMTAGTYWLDAVRVVRGPAQAYEAPAPVEVGAVCDRIYPIYLPGEKPQATVSVNSRLPRDTTVKIGYSILDWRERIVDQGQTEQRVPAGKGIHYSMPLYTNQLGAFKVLLRVVDPAPSNLPPAELIYGVFPEAHELADADQGFFCVDHQLTFGSEWMVLQGGDLDDRYRALRKLGIRWERSFWLGSWLLHEPEPGQWRWADWYVDAARRNGIKLMPIMGNSLLKNGRPMPEWAWDPERPAADRPYYGGKKVFYPKREHWTNFVTKFVQHYGDRIDAFEILNESGGCDAAPYVELLKQAHAAIKAVDPGARVVAPANPGGGMPHGPDETSWIGQVLAGGAYDYLDIYSPHLYPPNREGGTELETCADRNGTLEESLAKRMNYLRTAYGSKPVWDTETGKGGRSWYSWVKTLPSCADVSPRVQAEFWIRYAIMEKAAGVARVSFHILMRIEPVAVRELLESDGAPKPVAAATAQMARRLELAQFKEKITLGKATWIYLFEEQKHPVVVYWNYMTPDSGRLRVPVAEDVINAEDLMGNAIQAKVIRDRQGNAAPDMIELPLDASPVYVTSKRLSGEELLACFAKAVESGTVRGKLAVTLASSDGKPAVAIGANNSSSEPLNGAAQIESLPDGWSVAGSNAEFKAIPPACDQVLYLPLAQYASEATGAIVSVTGELDGQTFAAQRSLNVTRAAQRAADVVVDGRITEEEYGLSPALRLDSAGQVVSTEASWQGAERGSAVARLVWDKEALYVGMEIKDDQIINRAPLETLFRGDAVEIYLDTAPDRDMTVDAYKDHQAKLVCAPAMETNGAPRWFAQTSKPNGGLSSVALVRVQLASQRTAAGYTLELKIPVETALAAGTVWGFDLSLIDYDGAAFNKRCQLSWTGRKSWANPHAFGFVILKGNAE